MSITVFAAVTSLACAVSWAGLDAARKGLVGTVPPVALVVLLSAAMLPAFGAWAAVEGAWPIASAAYLRPASASLAFNIAGNLLFVTALRRSPLSLVIPLLAFVPAVSTLVGNVLLGELPSTGQLAGIAAVVAGALALGADDAQGRSPLAMARAIVAEPGTLPMLGVAVSWSLSLVFDKQAVQHVAVAAHALVLNAGVTAVLLTWLLVRRRGAELATVRRVPGVFAVAAVLATAALGLQLVAVQHVLVAVLEAIKRAIGIVAAVVTGRLLFDEPVTRGKLVAVGLMVLGTVAIVFG